MFWNWQIYVINEWYILTFFHTAYFLGFPQVSQLPNNSELAKPSGLNDLFVLPRKQPRQQD